MPITFEYTLTDLLTQDEPAWQSEEEFNRLFNKNKFEYIYKWYMHVSIIWYNMAYGIDTWFIIIRI